VSAGQRSTHQNDSIKIWRMMALADDFTDKCKYDSALACAELAKKESRIKNFQRGIAYANLKLAEIHYHQSDYPLIGKLDSAALETGKLLKDTSLIALSYYQLGQLFQAKEAYDAAEQIFQKSLSIKYEKEQSEYTGYIYNDLGRLYGEKGLLEKQLDWYLKAVRLHQKNKNQFGLAQCYTNLNDYYYELEKFEQAVQYGKLSFQIREKLKDYAGLANSCNNLSQTFLRMDSVQQAVFYQELGLKYAVLSELPSRIAHSYVSMSLLMNQQKKFREALAYEKKAIDLYGTVDRNVQSNRYIAAAFYCSILNDSSEAVNYFKKSEALARELNDKIVLRNVYQYMSDFYKARKNMQLAYDYYRKYYTYRDSLNNVEINKKISELQTQYESEKKDFEIERQKTLIADNAKSEKERSDQIDLLSKNQEMQELRIKQQDEQLERQLLLAQTQEQELQLAEKEKQLQIRKLKESRRTRDIILLSTAFLALLSYFLFNRYQLKRKIKEQEALLAVREKIAKDLHDEIGSTLTSIKILSEVTGKSINNDQHQASGLLNKISYQSSEMQQAMSDIVWAINPKNDKLEDIVVRMREYVTQTLEIKGVHTVVKIDDELLKFQLDMNQRKNLLLIFKEAVNNISKYAAAKNVEILLLKEANYICLRILDDGVGFDPGKARSSNGQKNMQARAKELNGTIDIESAPGKGTKITLLIPGA
ncbi:MAG: tetratricopeptide repeat protein, partial [Bacteroidota bacterium]